MIGTHRKKLFGFQAKVLVPIVTILVFLLATIMWLVNRRLSEELHEEARQNLTITEAVFRNSFDIRSRNLLLRYELLVNEPRFRAVAQLGEAKTMNVQLKELIDETAPDSKVMIFTTAKGAFLTGVQRDPDINLGKFSAQSNDLTTRAQQGRPGTDTIAVSHRLFSVISVPVTAEDNLAGVLTIGVDIGATAAQELKSLTRSEIVFLANHSVAAATLNNSSFFPQLIHSYKSLMERRSGQRTPMELMGPNGERFLFLAGTFAPSKMDVGYMLLSSYESALRKSASTQRILTALSIVGVLTSSILIWLLVRKVTRPLRELRQSAEAVGAGDFSQKVQVHSQDEFGELATVFNRMTENLTASLESLKNTQAQLVQSEKLSAIGEFVAGIAHELNNPLTGVIGFSEMLRESGMNEKQKTFVDRIIGSAERCKKIVQSLLSFSRRHTPDRKSVNLNALVESSIDAIKYELDTANIQVNTSLSRDIPPLLADPDQIQQVLLNIINNAKHALHIKKEGRLIRVTTELAGEFARTKIQDNGCGIAKEDLQKIFNPFFTTKPVGEGTGLGLSLCYGIIREHGGTISVESTPNHGATFTIDLPVRRAEEKQSPAAVDLPSAPQTAITSNGGRRILVIDDEQSILELIHDVLTEDGHQVEFATTGEQALKLVSHDQYDLVICDWKIPGTTGQQIYEELQRRNHANVEHFLFITGNVLSRETEQFFRTARTPYLLKPFSLSQLRTTIDKLLNS